MTHPIGYFTDCNQGRLLAERFGDHDLKDLPQVDQAGLVVALAGMFLAQTVGLEATTVADAAAAVIPESYDYTSDAINEAIEILDGINSTQAIEIIQFLVQEVSDTTDRYTGRYYAS